VEKNTHSPQQAQNDRRVSDVFCLHQVEDIVLFLRVRLCLINLQDTKTFISPVVCRIIPPLWSRMKYQQLPEKLS